MSVSESISLATTEELIQELFNRKTFAGVLIYSSESHKFGGQHHKEFKLLTTTEIQSTQYLLEVGLDSLKNNV